MQRLSLAELKAKANVLSNTEFITGGVEDGCHRTTSNPITIVVVPCPPPQDTTKKQ